MRGSRNILQFSKGFTLVEVLLVLIIVLVLASLVIPTVNRQLEEQSFKAEVWALRDRIVSGRIEAVHNGGAVDFHYDNHHIRWEADGSYSGDSPIVFDNGKNSAEITVCRITKRVRVSRIWDIQ